MYNAHWRLSFLLPLSVILGVSITIYLISIVYEYVLYSNLNYAAARIRNNEESRFAEVTTLLYDWKEKQHHSYPFSYHSRNNSQSIPANSRYYYPRISNPPGINIAILASNRADHKIDDYEPSYLTQTVVHLIQSIHHDIDLFGERYRFINITVCPTMDNLTGFTELNRIQQILGENSIKQRSRLLDSRPLKCQIILDIGNCLLLSSFSSSSIKQPSASGSSNFEETNDLVVLIEDDLTANKNILRQLWDLFLRVDLTNPQFGLIQLHTPISTIRYDLTDPHIALEFIALSLFFTFILISTCLRSWLRPFACFYNMIFVFCTFLTCVSVLRMINRFYILTFWHTLFQYQSIDQVATLPDLPWFGSAILMYNSHAQKLGHFLSARDCDNLNLNSGSLMKSSFIFDYFKHRGLLIWNTFPNLFKHQGLYSLHKKTIWDPRFVE